MTLEAGLATYWAVGFGLAGAGLALRPLRHWVMRRRRFDLGRVLEVSGPRWRAECNCLDD